MKTVTLYKFKELSENAQQNAIVNNKEYRENLDSDYHVTNKLAKEFHKVFGTNVRRSSWLDVRFDYINENVLNLKGLRLRTYLINHFGSFLYKGEFIFMFSNQRRGIKSRISKVFIGKSFAPDEGYFPADLYGPLYDFLEWKGSHEDNTKMDFKEIVGRCLKGLDNSLSEVEQHNASIQRKKMSRAYFLEDGTIFIDNNKQL